MKRLPLAACVVTVATLFGAGCASGTATITGTLVGADGSCLYVDVPTTNGTDRYWLRHLPAGYVTDERMSLGKPDGSLIAIGDSLSVSGTLSWLPFDRQCDGSHTLDATEIN